MNLQYLKYLVEVEKYGSITKAASVLFMGQPNLSKAIKETENELGIQIFKRSTKGVTPTEKGAEFLEYAKNIIMQMKKIETLFMSSEDMIDFSIAIPRASYITHAFTQFLNELGTDIPLQVNFKETNSINAIENVANGSCNLGIIRFENTYERYFMSMLAEKKLTYLELLRFDFVLCMSEDNPLARKETISLEDLDDYCEVLHGDEDVPYLSSFYVDKNSRRHNSKNRIYLYERGSQFDILHSVKNTYMWVAPLPEEIMERNGIVTRPFVDNSEEKKIRDLLIFRKKYNMSDAEGQFLDCLYSYIDQLDGTIFVKSK